MEVPYYKSRVYGAFKIEFSLRCNIIKERDLHFAILIG